MSLFVISAWEYRQAKKTIKVARPTRTDKAHKLGYKAKQVSILNELMELDFYVL